jgi:uncharacterized protein YwgA
MYVSLRLKKLAKLIRALEDAGIYRFKIDLFEDRLKLQKIVYIAKHFGIDLGYTFNEYIRGPYSPELADDYYKLKDIWDEEIRRLELLNNELDNENIKRLIEFLKGKSIAELEGIATGLMFLDILKRKGVKDKDLLRKKLAILIESRKPFLSSIVEDIANTVVSNFA